MIVSANVLGHALRIETASTGELGEEHKITVYYSEYAHGIDEEFANWYSDVMDFKLYLLAPGAEIVEISTVKKENFYTASFTPNTNGAYTIFIGHNSKDLDGDWLYQFNSSATVHVGSNSTASMVKEGNDLQVVLDSGTKSKISGTVYFKGQPLAEGEIAVVSPNLWSKSFVTDANGRFEIPSQGKGPYFLEATNVEDVTGEHFGKTYNHIWRCATMMCEIKE